jgi:polysaccharide biosynthesis/export protein
MSWRFAMVVLCSCALSGCGDTWDMDAPEALPGGAGIMANGDLAEGPTALASPVVLPHHGRSGVIQPYAAKGEAAAYEYSTGYRIGAGDKLSVRVAGEDDITGEYTVDPSGAISLPYVKSITVAGHTSQYAERLIVERLKNGYLRNPQVAVQLVGMRPFYIMGEVNTAGNYAYQPGISVQNAIAIAGGFGARADRRDVMLTRKNSTGTRTYRVSMTTQIYPGDIIYVRERWF